MITLDIKCISGLREARDVWTKLSPDSSIRDNWDFRYCFYKYFNYPLFFYAGYYEKEVVGLIPLQFNEKEGFLEFFGGNFMNDNRVFIRPGYEECIQQFYSAISQNATLRNIVGIDPFTESLDICEYKYAADLSDLKDVNDYFVKNFNSRSRKKLLRSIRDIESLKPEVIENNFDDFDILVELNKKVFGERSLFNKPHKIESYKDFLKSNFDTHILSYVINGKKEAVSFSVKYKDTYIFINAGTNKIDVPNLGTFNVYKNLEKAIWTGAKIFDAGLKDLGWKEKWHLKKFPRYLFAKEQERVYHSFS